VTIIMKTATAVFPKLMISKYCWLLKTLCNFELCNIW
jgi:hypothetical protein